MAASTEEILFSKFEDLIDKDDSDVLPSEIASDDIDESAVHKLDANALTLNDLLHEMERRGLHPRGFFEDDAKVLQAEFDKEHKSYVESKRREMLEARAQEAKRAVLQKRRMMMQLEMKEEREEIGKDRIVADWHRAVKNSVTKAHCRFYLNDITARSLAKALWDNNSIISLDVSNMDLSDLAGAYICRSLRNNRSISKLELGGNFLGTKTCKALGDSLETNHVVKYISLESNPLTKDDNDNDDEPAGITALSKMLTVNRSLFHLSLWQCNIGRNGCRILHDAITKNDHLVCFDLGYNEWTQRQTRDISDRLEKNRSILQRKKERENELIAERLEKENIQKKINREREKKDADEKWIEDKKTERSDERRRALEREEVKRMEEEERRVEEQRREREKKEAEASKKKKKGKKGKKKGK